MSKDKKGISLIQFPVKIRVHPDLAYRDEVQ